MTTIDVPIQRAHMTPRSFASRRDDFVSSFCGAWMVAGVFVDGWAHRNGKAETFFTPWHALLYSGFVAGATWILFIGRKNQVPGQSMLPTLPVGYGVRGLGAAVFGVGGGLDLVWHQVFGIETSIEALLSPTHLLLLAGALLMMSGTVVSTIVRGNFRTASWSVTGATISAVTFILAVFQFFLMYITPYKTRQYMTALSTTGGGAGGGRGTGGVSSGTDTAALAIGAILLFSLTTWFALAWLIRNVGLPRGAFLVVMVVPAFFQTILESLRPANLLLGPLAAAVVAELTWPRLAPMLHRSAVALASWASGLVLVTWLGLFAGAYLSSDLGWQVELWAGSSVLAALLVGMFIVSTDPTLPSEQSSSSGFE